MPVAPRIVNNVSYVTTINDAWQAQYLVRLEGDACCSAHCKWRFVCHGYQSWESFFVAGAVFGDLRVSLFVAGVVFGEMWVDSRSAKCCNFQYKMRLRSAKSNLGELAGARWRVHARIMFGSCSDHARIVPALELTLQLFSANFSLILECHFAWQAQYLVRLEVDACCSAHCKWRFICDDNQWCASFFVAGAVFGDVGVSHGRSIWWCFSAKLVAVDGLARLLLWVSILFLLCFCVLKSVSRYWVVAVMFFCQACRCGRPGAPANLGFHPVLSCTASTHTLGSWAQGVHCWPGADAVLCFAMTCPTMR